jgi:DNA-binding transcriptional ArsR family regulator
MSTDERRPQHEGEPELLWDMGTAYDMFISLYILHDPAKYGLRGAWAAGVRSRLPAAEREFLEEYLDLYSLPFDWIYRLPEPKDAGTALFALKQLPPQDRIPNLFLDPAQAPQERELFLEIAARGKWTPKDRDQIHKHLSERKELTLRKTEKLLDQWAQAPQLGDDLLNALQAYQDVFFAEEEKRIEGKLREGLEGARALSEKLSFFDLLEELSQGFRLTELKKIKTVVFVPSYWATPLVFFSEIQKNTMLLTFGARPADDSLVPGEVVSDALLRALKALSDPTRLRILRYLTHENLTPAELSRRLRLRAPTVTHHLHALRLAGLVRFTMMGKNERLYSARLEAVNATFAALKAFLEQGEIELEDLEILAQERVS